MKKLRSGLSVACVISLVAMIGCQVKPPATPSGTDEATLNRGGGRTANPATGGQAGATAGQAGGATAGQAGTANGQTGGSAITNPGGAGTLAPGEVPKALAQGTPSREAVLAQVQAMDVSAAAGGLYKSADGGLQAIIPPDALSGDTQVKFAALDTSGLTATAIMTPGIVFAMDLGGAALKEGQAIIVKSKVDQRFVDEFQRSAPGKDPASAGLSQENGVWYLSMPVKAISGPDAESMQTNHVVDSLATVEMQPAPATYGLKQAASPSPAPTATPTAAPTPVPTPTPVPKLPTTPSGDATVDAWEAMTAAQKADPSHRRVDSMVVRAVGHDVTLQMRNDRNATLGTADKSEYIQCFIGHGWCASGTIYDAIDGTIKFNKGVDTNHLPPTGLTQAVGAMRSGTAGRLDWDCGSAQTLVDITVKARYTSDDPAVHHVAASDATITRLASGATMSDGPQAQLTFKMGLGVSFKVYGSINRPVYAQSAKVDVTAAQGLAPITVDIVKNSPKITLNVEADAPLTGGAALTVDYLLGTEARTESLIIPAGTAQNFSGSFYARVPNDNNHNLTIKRVYGENFDDDGTAAINAAFPVHRNGVYAKNIKVKLNAPK